MTMRRAAPGAQVSSGRLRVDAARAIAKLREYQLADRAAWVLEGIRAAVAAGATRIELRGDANDIWLAWHGTPWESEILPRLFDELVSPEPAAERQQVRLLAAAVNSALGMKPAFVDVYSVTAKGFGLKVRYTPDVLAEPETELGDAKLRHVEVEEAVPPTDISTGMLVHLRRRPGFSLLSYWIGEPPELPLARGACKDIAVPLVLDGDVVLKRDASNDLVRVPLGEGLDGFVAITNQLVAPSALLEVAERGVVLARYPFDVLGFTTQIPVPVRVFLDADRLPTNASRSQVRRDVHPIASGERRALQVIGTAIAELATLTRAPDSALALRARRAALSLLASSIAGHPVTWKHPALLLAPLAALPLVRNALGEERAVETAWSRLIHTHRKPVDPELKPWLGEMLWAPPDDPVHVLLAGAGIDTKEARDHVRAARRQLRAHQKFLAHSKREIKVQTSTYPRARVSLGVAVERSCVPQSMFDGVTGEVCVYPDGSNGAVVLCVEGRELERVEWTTQLPFDAVVDSARLSPGERYRGVRRDDAYAAVTQAVRAGVIRAIESIIVESPHIIDSDMELARRAIAQAQDLKLEITGPLAQVGAWRTSTGTRASVADLQASKYIGVIGEGETVSPLRNRIIIHSGPGEREGLRRLFGTRILPYHRATTARRMKLDEIAVHIPRFIGAAGMIVRGEELSGAIALSSRSALYWYHHGIALGETEYKHELFPCSIAISSDVIAPNEKWTGVFDDAGLGKRSFRDWELALLRALAQRLVIGEDVPDLIDGGNISLADDNGRVLVSTLSAGDPYDLLGGELCERFCNVPLFRQLGKAARVSIKQLAYDNVHSIFYVEGGDASVVDDFAPVIASEPLAKLIGKLARRRVLDGSEELRDRQRRALKKMRIDDHLARPEEPLELVSDLPTAQFRGRTVAGILGIAPAAPEVRIRVENRTFTTAPVSIGSPVIAVVDLAMSECSDTFDGVPKLVLADIMDDMKDAVPELLTAIAKAQPRLFGQPTAARTLLARFLETHESDKALRELLVAMPAFATVQGEWVAVSEATVAQCIRVATFADEWLPPGDGESPVGEDTAIFFVPRPPDDLNIVLEYVYAGVVADVTSDVARLQAKRRMARGMLPTPKLGDIPQARKRPLKALGEAGRKLGHGELGFSLTPQSQLLIHEQGQLRRTMDIDVLPAVQLAVESPHEVFDHDKMRNVMQELAVELVRVVLPELGDVPGALRFSLARAVLSRRIPPVLVGATPLFQRLDGGWLTWAELEAQLAQFGNVWAVVAVPRYGQPLDEARIVIQLDAADIELATRSGYNIINAKLELELDGKARENRARPPMMMLRLPIDDGILAQVELEGDGRTSPRGKVAVLVPAEAAGRGLFPHRAMQALDRVEDPCRWPTITVLDDARIVPDRTWSLPEEDETWQSIVKDVREASEEALKLVGQAPGSALAEIRITNHVCADVRAIRDAPRTLIRGMLWLTPLPYGPSVVAVRHRDGIRSFVPAQGTPIGGTLAVYTPDQLDFDAALEQLCGICHGKLVRALSKDKEHERDVVAAHVAHAIAIGTVSHAEISGITFDCFAPRPLEPRALGSLFKRVDPVPYVTRHDPELPTNAFVDDNTEVAKVVRAHIGDRMIPYERSRPKPAPPPPPTKPPVSTTRPAASAAKPPPQPAAAPKPPPPKKPHALQPLIEALGERVARTGIQVTSWVIVDEAEPLVGFRGMQVVIAGDNPRLVEIARQLATSTPRALLAIDALAAHVITVLNIARTDVTDATEMHALGVLLASPPSASPQRSPRSS